MTPRDLRNIHTTRNSCRDALSCANMALKLPRYFYLLMVTSWSLLPSSVSLLSGGTVQPENTYSCILKVTGQVWESQKRTSITLITATTSIHLPKPVSTDLTIKPDSVLTNPIGKDGVQSWSM